MELLGGILRIESFLAVTIGIVVLFVGKRLNERPGRLLVDPETGEEVNLRPATSSLFFIPMQWWAPLIAVAGKPWRPGAAAGGG
jgi:hypothetical protein